MAMANMVAEMEAGKEDEGGKVEVLDIKEEADDKELATDKLKAIVSSSKIASEIEGAIGVARANGVDQAEIDKAEDKVKLLKGKAKALDRLRMAIDSPDVESLESAIKEAEKEGCPKEDIAKAQAALKAEIPKQKARDGLKTAQDSGDAGKLKAAIKAAEDAKLSAEEIDAFKNLLAGAENKDKAAAALKEAVTSKDVAQLKFSIQQAKDVGVDAAKISEAEKILKEEEPKAKAREIIAAALEKRPVDIPGLKAAAQAGKDAKLEPSEYKECEDMVRAEEERAKALVELKQVFESVASVDMSQIETIQAAKTKLSEAINKAKSNGVAETDLNEYELRRRKLHNAIEDLKGSIRVFCRVRPLSSKEKNQGDTEVTKQIDGMTISITDKQEFKFNFDAVFMPGTQEQVFEDCRDLVQSAADGYNVTLFAYGQTGAGKTYTMAVLRTILASLGAHSTRSLE
jgi:kinesin family protein C1